MQALQRHRIDFCARDGALVGQVELVPIRDGISVAAAPIVQIDSAEAAEFGESSVQLREAERYEYTVIPCSDRDLRLRCSLAQRRRSLDSDATPDSGMLETKSFCGALSMELVDGAVDAGKATVASAQIDIRSLKIDYRTDYRGMLKRLSRELVGLAVDARSSARLPLMSATDMRSDPRQLQVQAELLRAVLDDREFAGAVRRIVDFPHEGLGFSELDRAADLPSRWAPSAVQRLLTGQPRRSLPPTHPLRAGPKLVSIAERVRVVHRVRDLDTPENRFVKFALNEFGAFLCHASLVFERSQGWDVPARTTRRLALIIEGWLRSPFFRDVGRLRFVPLGSAVLQRKSGYREILGAWLRYRTGAQISWESGEALFGAGQRDVASLYEYWLFFELLDWFCNTCRSGERPALEEMVDGLDGDSASLRIRRGEELGPFFGVFEGRGRALSARFSYNRRFAFAATREESGSWTRALHPDYTLTFWPAELTEQDAERLELLVHLHLDAKYRVEDVGAIFGAEGSDDVDSEVDGNYKRQDLLKMHSYRDAIRRSQGAFVLYPGHSIGATRFMGYHEVLPGLGAFAIIPDREGNARGMDVLRRFLDDVLQHLSNRTTAQERMSFHLYESYVARDRSVAYGNLRLREDDAYCATRRAVPPAEHMVLAVWYENDLQRELAEAADGLSFVRLGRRRGALHVHPTLAAVRHLLMRTHGPAVAPGLVQLREPGFRVFTRAQLRAELAKHAKGLGVTAWERTAGVDDDEFIYAVFRTSADSAFSGQRWNAEGVMRQIEECESDVRNRPVVNLGRSSPYPRVLTLRGLLSACEGE